MSTIVEDQTIVALYESRDEDAIKHTEEKYGKYCLSIAKNILANDQDAEECVNSAYMRTWESIPPAHPQSLQHFLAKITRNLALNIYKDQRCQKRGGGEEIIALGEIEEFLADTRDVSDEVSQRELVRLLNRFLYSLPKRDAGIFIRRYWFREPTRKVAAFFGIKESNAMMILSRTRQKLKKHLQKEGFTL